MTLPQDRWADPAPSLAAKLAQFLHRHENKWIDGRTLATIAGAYAWRTRISDLRKQPFNMCVINRQRSIKVGTKSITVSEYMFVTVTSKEGIEDREGAASGVSASPAAV